ncbi:hypothetical protein M1L60_36840 [Actinoplanes sp. TRM 88003]|uniref:Uncharacterized protein n=1 Tax=Paractinoplanes aksuensis TaxID=2939490 RepID=A0ABT1DZ53_9ACTN|nr:hypothetical protein [Actinoplanes aksuensis]MCO8276159.1 hypothetical protein [Actinoplanes aksuensis]
MATHQLIVVARPARRPVPGGERYESVIYDLTIEVDTAIGRCVAAAAWLKPAFPAGCLVNVQFQPHEGDELLIEKPRSKNRGGPKEIICPVGVPVSWFDGGGHGVPAIRLLRAVFQVLALVGKNFGAGPPQLRGRISGGKSAAVDPFRPPEPRPSPYAAAGAELDRMARDTEPGQLVVAALGSRGERRAEILGALGTTEAESVLNGPGREKVRTWTVRSHP